MELLNSIFGQGSYEGFTHLLQMSARAALVFVTSIFILRFAHRRFLGKFAPFDIILAFMIGSLLSRSINGKAPVFETIAIVLLIIVFHHVLAVLSLRFPRFGRVTSGQPREIARDGKVLKEEMESSRIGEEDLMEALRLRAHTQDLSRIKNAFMERNGNISIVMEEQEKN